MVLFIGVYNHIYEVSKFIANHPGEGIKDEYLMNYNYQETTDAFDKHHFTNEADEMLINAKENGFDEETGIFYVCPYYFQNKIPNYFHFFPDLEKMTPKKYMENKNPMTFILSSKDNYLILTIKNEDSSVENIKIQQLNGKWYIIWRNAHIMEKTIEKIIKKFVLNNYKPNN
jgi:hypothetical protein